MEDTPLFQPANQKELRAWFDKNHQEAKAVWIVIFKKDSGKQVLTLNDILEEAISHGWIDSKVKSIDDERYSFYLTPRKVGSHWTDNNKRLAERMILEGRMTVHGMDVYATGK